MHHEVEDAQLVPDTRRLADRVHRHADGNRPIHRDFLEVDVYQGLRDGIELHVPDDRHTALGAPVERERQEPRAPLVAVDQAQHIARVGGDRHRRGPAVEDAGNPAAAAQALRDRLARALATLDGEASLFHAVIRS